MIRKLNKKGFTIIELIAVIAILAILVLLAMLNMGGHGEKARIAHIKHDVKVAEGIAEEYLIKDGKLPENWTNSDIKNSTKDIYDTRGLVENVIDGDYKVVPKKEINSKLPGHFHANENGKVYYEDDTSFSDNEYDHITKVPDGCNGIYNDEDLNNIRNGETDCNILMNNIEMTGSEYNTAEEGWDPIMLPGQIPYKGYLDGNGYVISGLNIKNTKSSGGLFGVVKDFTVENLTIESSTIDLKDKDAGFIVGNSIGNDEYSNIEIRRSNINIANGNDNYVGGLIGTLNGYESTIENARIKELKLKSDSGKSNVGGIVGMTFGKEIKGIVVEKSNLSLESGIIGGAIGFVNNGTLTDIETKNVKITTEGKGDRSSIGGVIGSLFQEGKALRLKSNVEIDIKEFENTQYSQDYSVGGVIGEVYGEITDSKANVNINLKGGKSFNIGGIAGSNHESILKNSTANVNVNVVTKDHLEDSYAAGLVGQDYGGIEDSEANGNIIVRRENQNGNISVAGLSGYSNKNIKNVRSSVNIQNNGKGNDLDASISTAGLVADYYRGKIFNAESSGEVIGDKGNVGGLIGQAHGEGIYNSHSIGNVKTKYGRVGGLVGELYTTIENSYATGDVSSLGGHAGGLVGRNNGNVRNSYATGNVHSEGNYVGGLIGSACRSVEESHSTGNVFSKGDYVGGLIGRLECGGAQLEKLYATGNVEGRNKVGGIVGSLTGGLTMKDTEAKGNIKGGSQVGGIVGEIKGGNTIENAIYTGKVTGDSMSTGGIVGYQDESAQGSETIIKAYYDSSISGILKSGYGNPKETDELKKKSTFEGWDFKNIWNIKDGLSYPTMVK